MNEYDYIRKDKALAIFRKVLEVDLKLLVDMKELLKQYPIGDALPREYILDKLIATKQEILANLEEHIV